MSAAPRLRVGFLSAVRHARPYAHVLAADPRVEIVGVAEEPDVPAWIADDSADVAASAGVPFHRRLDPILDPAGVDLVVVCSEPTRHARLAAEALDAGIHVLVDKPVATTLADADALIAAEAASAGTATVVNRLPSPSLQRLRRWVDAGHLGLPLHVDAEWFASGTHFATSVERPELVVDPDLSGGGELLNFLLYPLDAIRHLTGLEVVDVHCEASTLFTSAHRHAGVEDAAAVSLLLQRGVTATVTLGRIPAAPGLGAVTSTLRLLGSHGHATADDDQPALALYHGAGGVEAVPLGGPSSDVIVAEVLHDTVSAVLQGRAPRYRLTDARASLAATLAAVASARTGQPEAPG